MTYYSPEFLKLSRQKEIVDKLKSGIPLSSIDRYEARNLSRGTGIGYEHLLIVLVVMKLSKTSQGLDVIKALGKEFIRGIFDMMHSLGQAAAANKVTSWANPYLCAMVLDRVGLVNPDYMLEFKVGLSLISGAVVAEDFVDTLKGILPFTSCEPSEYPTNIVFSARDADVEVPKEISWKELSELMRAGKKK